MMDYLRSLDFVHYILYGLAITTTIGVAVSRYLKLPKTSKIREYSEAGFFAIWVALAVRATVAEAQSIPSESMVPTFLVGDNLLVTKYNWGYHIPGTKGRVFDFGKPSRGDIVTFLPPLKTSERKNYVKRCVGIPGDTIEVRAKRVFINGKSEDYPEAIAEVLVVPPAIQQAFTAELANGEKSKAWFGPYDEQGKKYWVLFRGRMIQVFGRVIDHDSLKTLKPNYRAYRPGFAQLDIWNGLGNVDNYGPYTLKPNEYWMMGDNRDNSRDSRYFGPVIYDDLRGNPVFRYYPFNARFGSID
jgi:signal peptidase I